MRNRGQLRIKLRHDRINRRVEDRIEKILRIFAQSPGEIVDAGDIESLIEHAADRVGYTQQRADVAVQRIVDEVEHLDARQLHRQVLRKIKIHLSGREFLEPAVHVENRQFHLGVLKTFKAAEHAVERERIIKRSHVQPVALGAWMILRRGGISVVADLRNRRDRPAVRIEVELNRVEIIAAIDAPAEVRRRRIGIRPAAHDVHLRGRGIDRRDVEMDFNICEKRHADFSSKIVKASVERRRAGRFPVVKITFRHGGNGEHRISWPLQRKLRRHLEPRIHVRHVVERANEIAVRLETERRVQALRNERQLGFHAQHQEARRGAAGVVVGPMKINAPRREIGVPVREMFRTGASRDARRIEIAAAGKFHLVEFLREARRLRRERNGTGRHRIHVLAVEIGQPEISEGETVAVKFEGRGKRVGRGLVNAVHAADADVVFCNRIQRIPAAAGLTDKTVALRRRAEIQAGVIGKTGVVAARAGPFQIRRIRSVTETGKQNHRRPLGIGERGLIPEQEGSCHAKRARADETGLLREISAGGVTPHQIRLRHRTVGQQSTVKREHELAAARREWQTRRPGLHGGAPRKTAVASIRDRHGADVQVTARAGEAVADDKQTAFSSESAPRARDRNTENADAVPAVAAQVAQRFARRRWNPP